MDSKKNKTTLYITNNFNAPIGQHIDHVDAIHFSMDRDGTFHFGQVDSIAIDKQQQQHADYHNEQEKERPHMTAIRSIRAEGLLKHAYDYAWIMEVMNNATDMPHFSSAPAFIEHLKDSGLDKLPSSSTINKKLRNVVGHFPEWTFLDCDEREALRRVNLTRRFVSIYRKAG